MTTFADVLRFNLDPVNNADALEGLTGQCILIWFDNIIRTGDLITLSYRMDDGEWHRTTGHRYDNFPASPTSED